MRAATRAAAAARQPRLRILLAKRADGSAVLRCERADGSITWQRQDGRRGAFFPFHDLGHYAVESVLGLRRGFFGLVAEGWDIAETEGRSERGPLPAETILAEHVVGWLDAERASGDTWSAAALAEYLQQRLGDAAPSRSERGAFTEDELQRVRARVAELHRLWFELPAGQELALSFA